MMEMTQELTASVLSNALKHGKFNIPLTNAIENAIAYLTPVPAEMEGGGHTWFEVCGECHTTLNSWWKVCPECGRPVERGNVNAVDR